MMIDEKPVVVGDKTYISVKFNIVSVNIICGDEYEAQVLYDDLAERAFKEGFDLSIRNKKK